MSSRLRLFRASVLVAAAFEAAAPTVRAQDWSWPEKPKNLQVLPKDFGGEKLRAVMRGFTRALGVRCQYCHVGQEGKPLSTFDFASDENPNKARAREMYRMLGDINAHLKKIQPSGDKRVNMWCNTCHEGRPRPTTLTEQLGEAYRKSGADGALARYRELRERYYGRGGYDFREGVLVDFAEELGDAKDREGAIAVLQLNAAEFPKSGDAWCALGDGYLASGDSLLAGIYYRKALEVDPRNGEAVERLRKLEKKPE